MKCRSISSISGGTGLESENQYYRWDFNDGPYARDYIPNYKIWARRRNRGKGEVGPLIELMDIAGVCHQAIKLEKTVSKGAATEGKHYHKPRKCARCKEKMSRVKCKHCGIVLCYPLKDQTEVIHSCFYKHVNELKKEGGELVYHTASDNDSANWNEFKLTAV